MLVKANTIPCPPSAGHWGHPSCPDSREKSHFVESVPPALVSARDSYQICLVTLLTQLAGIPDMLGGTGLVRSPVPTRV